MENTLSPMIRYLASWANIRSGETCASGVAKIASDLIQASAWRRLPITGDLLWVSDSRSNGGILKVTCFRSAPVGTYVIPFQVACEAWVGVWFILYSAAHR
jgi:hypothetical protein